MKRKSEVAAINPSEWTPAKQELLEEQEGIVEESKAAFGKVTAALMIIKTEGLYLKTHHDFKTYCRERFGFTGEWARRLLQVTEVDEVLGEGNSVASKNVNVGAALLKKAPIKAKLELAGLSEGTVKKVAAEIGKSGVEKVTTKEVKKIVAQVQHKPIPEDDEEPAPEPKCPKCGKKTSGPTADWVKGLVCICDNKAEPKPIKIPALEGIKTQTSLNLHPVLIALDNEWVTIQRGLAYGDWKPVQIYQKLRTAVEKAIVTNQQTN